MDVAEEADLPPEVSIAELRKSADVDAKLQEGADRARRNREARAARGQPTNLMAAVRQRMDEAIAAAPRTASGAIARIGPLEVPDAFNAREVLRTAMVAERFLTATLDGYEPATPAQSAALAAARQWVERAKNGDGGMLAIIGPQGTGKSHLLYAAGNALIDTGRRVYGRPWYRLADELRYGGKNPVTGRAIDASEVRTTLWDYPVVLLDEVRPTASTAFDDTELAKFACWAYDSKMAVFITSNVSPLADVMGPPAASRFTQIIIDGPDRRQV